MRDIHTIFQLLSYKTVSLFEILVKWGTILPSGNLPWGVGSKEMIFLFLLYMRYINTNFWLLTSKTVTFLEIVVMGAILEFSWGGG